VLEGDTSVMVLDGLRTAGPPLSGQVRVQVTDHLDDAWFAFYVGLGGRNQRQAGSARAIMEHIVPPCRFVLLEGEDGPSACALTVVEDGWAGIFDVAVREDLRGRGLGRQIMAVTTGQAVLAGARRAYLQVVRDNRPAVQLYLGLGYTVVYPYWYRIKKAPE
jgi:GNAT superfamily N-acetyltransferase